MWNMIVVTYNSALPKPRFSLFIFFGKVAFVPEMSAMVENNKMKVQEDHGRKVDEQIQHL